MLAPAQQVLAFHSHLFALRTQRESCPAGPSGYRRYFVNSDCHDRKETDQKGSTPIVVRVTPDEKAVIESLAKQTGHSTSAYLRLLGQGYVPKSIIDHGKVMELARINGDLGRLGGLLKLWLTNDARTAQFGEEHPAGRACAN